MRTLLKASVYIHIHTLSQVSLQLVVSKVSSGHYEKDVTMKAGLGEEPFSPPAPQFLLLT